MAGRWPLGGPRELAGGAWDEIAGSCEVLGGACEVAGGACEVAGGACEALAGAVEGGGCAPGGVGPAGVGCEISGVDPVDGAGSGGAAGPRTLRYQGCRSMASTSHSILLQITCRKWRVSPCMLDIQASNIKAWAAHGQQILLMCPGCPCNSTADHMPRPGTPIAATHLQSGVRQY